MNLNYLPSCKTVLTALAFSLCTPLLVNAQEYRTCPANWFSIHNVYLKVEAGASFSESTSLSVTQNNDPLNWDPASQGYNNDLGTSEIVGLSLGYSIYDWIDVELEAAHRNSFRYQKTQTSTGAFGDKTRYFDIENTTVMANVFLNGNGLSQPIAYRTSFGIFDPFVTAGLGVAFNHMTDFHSTATTTGDKFSAMNPNTTASFAYQVGAGINLRTTQRFMFGLGYRYLDAGNFESNKRIVDAPSGIDDAASPWKGELKVNEVYLALTYWL